MHFHYDWAVAEPAAEILERLSPEVFGSIAAKRFCFRQSVASSTVRRRYLVAARAVRSTSSQREPRRHRDDRDDREAEQHLGGGFVSRAVGSHGGSIHGSVGAAVT